jgi:hypothetical protein
MVAWVYGFVTLGVLLSQFNLLIYYVKVWLIEKMMNTCVQMLSLSKT